MREAQEKIENMNFHPQADIPTLPANEVHLWLARVNESEDDHLSAKEIARASKYHRKIDHLRYRTSRSILRKILGGYLSTDPSEIQLELDPLGKPRLSKKFHSPNVEFNISHSDQIILFAFARTRRVGVDIEHVRPFPELTSLVRRYFTEDERSAIRRIPKPERTAAFFSGWTRKEAFLKAIGKGLQIPLNSFEVSLDPDEKEPHLVLPQNLKQESHWRLMSFSPAEGTIAALAVEGQEWKIKSYKFV